MAPRLLRSEVRVAYRGALTAEIESDSIPGTARLNKGMWTLGTFAIESNEAPIGARAQANSSTGRTRITIAITPLLNSRVKCVANYSWVTARPEVLAVSFTVEPAKRRRNLWSRRFTVEPAKRRRNL